MFWGAQLDRIAQAAGEGFPRAIFEERPASVSDKTLNEVSMKTLIANASSIGAHHGYRIDYPWGENGSYGLMPRSHGDIEHLVYAFFDRRDGRLLERYGWDDLGKVGRATTFGVAFHESHLFGRANQWMNAAVVLCVILLVITGPIMWWLRKPPHRLGAPSAVDEPRLPSWFFVLLAGVGVLLPVFGVSVLAILLVETIRSRLRPAR